MGGRSRDPRTDCMRLLAHDLNNLLTAIRILAEMLRDQATDATTQQDMQDILEAADLASALMDGMASLAMLDGADEEYTWFSVDLCHPLRAAADRPALRDHVAFDLPAELTILADENSMQRALTDILMNARKLVEGGAPILVRAVPIPDGIEVRVHHAGEGLDPLDRERLFEAYGAVPLRRRRLPVSATGLAYAYRVIEAHRGTMGFESVGSGMDLVIRLPR